MEVDSAQCFLFCFSATRIFFNRSQKLLTLVEFQCYKTFSARRRRRSTIFRTLRINLIAFFAGFGLIFSNSTRNFLRSPFSQISLPGNFQKIPGSYPEKNTLDVIVDSRDPEFT